MTGSRLHPRFDARPHAVVLVLGSGLLLLLLGVTLQAIAWDATAFFDQMRTEPPYFTARFMSMFGLRPHSHVMSVTLWFWWPMVASLIYCLLRYRRPREFSRAFAYWIAICWLLVGLGVAAMLATLSLMRYILFANVQQPPEIMGWVPTVSRLLPFAVVMFAAACWWRLRRAGVVRTGEGVGGRAG